MAKREDGCIFCAIVAGEAEAEIVYSDERAVAFLDQRPLFHGHVLIVPRDHHETLADLPADQVGPLFELVAADVASPSATGWAPRAPSWR